MPDQPVEVVRTLEKDTLEKVAWRLWGADYRPRMPALRDANPTLVTMPPVLPAGTEVRIPAEADLPAEDDGRPARLWD